MKIKAINEECFLITLGTKIDLNLTAKIASLNQQIKHKLGDHLIDTIPSYTTILVQFNLLTIAPLVVYKQLDTLLYASLSDLPSNTNQCHRLPVFYDRSVAPDLLRLAEQKGMTVEQVISLHSQQQYQVCALGFSPGFAFLAEVDPRLQQARLETPRANVKAGSVAIADKQTAVYPSDSPGGWNIIGHCPNRLFDMNNSPISDFKVGDKVEFYAINQQQYLALMETNWGSNKALKTPNKILNKNPKNRYGLKVIDTGILSSLQDAGRFGQSEQGVSQGGYADFNSARWANYLLKNAEHSTLIEITVGGAEFLALSDLYLALTGAEMNAQVFDKNNQLIQSVKQQTFKLLIGQRLKLSFASVGVRAYLAVKSGFDVVKVLGSCSTVKRNQVGGLVGDGQALKKGDLIAVVTEAALKNVKHNILDVRMPACYHIKPQQLTKIGLIESYQNDLFNAQQKAQLYQQVYSVNANSDRMGMRLSGQPLSNKITGVISEAIALGSVQIPADGIPIILLQDRQTLGGYPKIGCICRHDLAVLAQLPAGANIQFYPVSLLQAQMQYRQHLQFFNKTTSQY